MHGQQKTRIRISDEGQVGVRQLPCNAYKHAMLLVHAAPQQLLLQEAYREASSVGSKYDDVEMELLLRDTFANCGRRLLHGVRSVVLKCAWRILCRVAGAS